MKKRANHCGCTHTHTHTIHLFKNVFCFYACNFGVAGLVLCAQNLIEDG